MRPTPHRLAPNSTRWPTTSHGRLNTMKTAVSATRTRCAWGGRVGSVAPVWAEARDNCAYWDRVRADWDSGLVANLKLAAEPQSDLLFYRRLRRLVALLGDGRAAVIAPPTLRSRIARPPLLVSSVERRPLLLD